MSSCCICQFSVRSNATNPVKNIYEETIGDPPVSISLVLLQCTKGTDFHIESASICKKCCEKLSRYHKSIQIAKKLRQEILELIRSPFIIQEFKTTLTRVEYKDVYGEEDEAEANIDEGLKADKAPLSDALEPADDDSEKTFVEKYVTADESDAQEEFQMVDIENEIVIHDQEEEVEPKENPAEEEVETLKDDNLSEFEDQLDGTIEYLISDNEDMDHYSSGDYTVNIQCPSCPEQFSNRRAYNAHTKREHFPGYVCDQCGKTLQSYSGFIGHLQNHEPVKQFECPECGERFNRKFRLKHHMAWHTGETPYQCEICSKRFVHKVALYKHKMIHDNDTKRLECQVCEFKTRTKAHLERHMRSHTGAKPFCCPVCNKRFSQMYNMKAHLREHENPGCNRQRRFHCPKCTHSFINEQNFVNHVQRGDCTSA
ncbi:zinc finger protein 774 [Scaptodrosophila lebanonensis]|uniref:Zinc finger protein 774 n=1 Tax=Drosophila lebanonensis TaxID=7225 RepID=A0A6J2T6V2_DROLE|nr:zinc finger protein 774 [Scaptodrosophila lebanonensis]